MSLTATSVPETVGASDYLPTVVPSPAPSVASTPTLTVGVLAAETDPGLYEMVAPRARLEGVVTLVEEGDGTPDMGSHLPAGSKHPAPTTSVGVGEALLVPMTPPPPGVRGEQGAGGRGRSPGAGLANRPSRPEARTPPRATPSAAVRHRRPPARHGRHRGMKRHSRRLVGTRQRPSRRWEDRPRRPWLPRRGSHPLASR